MGKTYQLADPDPLTIDEVLTAVAKATGRLMIRVPLPVGVAKAAIDWVPGVYRLTLRARDEAGNLSPPSAPVLVRVSR